MRHGLLLLVLVSAVGAFAPVEARGADRPERAIALVGSTEVTGGDEARRVAVQVARGQQANAVRALLELLREALESEVARAAGAAPTAEDLAALDRHAESSSREPETLSRLRRLLSDEDFARHVLAPRATALKLRDRFAAEPAEAAAGDYDAWYRERAARVAIELDAAAARRACAAAGEVWWLQAACSAAPRALPAAPPW